MSTFTTIFLSEISDNKSGREKSSTALVRQGDWSFTQLGNYTVASPLLVSNGNTSKITFQLSDITYTYGNGGIDTSYDFTDQKFIPSTVNDLFTVEVRMKVKSSAQNSHLDLKVESPSFAFNPLNAQTHNFVHSANDEQFMSSNFMIFISPDVKANGIEFKVTAHDGNISIYDVSYLIYRMASGI